MPKNLNMLRYSLENMTPEERRKLLALEESANGEDFMTRQAMMGEQPSRQSPFQGMVMGNSGGSMTDIPNAYPMMTPAMLMSRAGYQGDNLRAGASGVMVRMPDGTIKMMPGGIDAGYNTDLGNGGNLDIGGMYAPRGMFNVNARYTKKF